MTSVSRALLISSFIGFIGVGLFGPIYAIFVKQIGGDVLEAGVAYGLFSLVSGAFVWSVGRSRFFKNRARRAVVLGYALFTAGNAGYLLVQTPAHLFLVQILLGIAGGILEPSWDGVFSSNLTEDQATDFWARWAGARDVATGIGALAGGVLVTAYSFRLLFVVVAALSFVATIVSTRVLGKEK